MLELLSFGRHSVASACFGLGMVLLSFFLIALFFLDRSAISYITLGHVGRNAPAVNAYEVPPPVAKTEKAADAPSTI